LSARDLSLARRALLLDEMGIGPVWQARQRTEPSAPAGTEAALAALEIPAMQDVELPETAIDVAASSPSSRPAITAATSEAPRALPVETSPVSDDAIAQMDWSELQAAVASCTRCGLCASRNKTVFGVGDAKANWLFVGEGPGYNEDRQGEPFVGPAGKLLDNMLAAMHLRRGENAFIANIVKCRPTDASGKDRPPAPAEAAACLPYLERQIALMQPRMLVALGKTAAVSLLGLDPETSLGSLRGRLHRHGGLAVTVTYHPAYLLRTLRDKAKSWQDLCLALEAEAEIAANADSDATPA
jgi:uracil-DNA glycosylase family 4